MERIPVVIDTDGGIDDAAALWWALQSPALDVVAITSVWGNVDVEVAAANVCRVLHAVGRPDIPVTVGLPRPILPAPSFPRADFIHGVDGVGNTGRAPAPFGPTAEPAVEMLHRLAASRDGELVLVTLGPLSNIGAAVAADASFATQWRELVVMGGAVGSPGNAQPIAEANIAHDPGAADLVAQAAWRRPPVLVGLDVTQTATLTDVEFELAAAHRNPAAGYLDPLLRFYRPFGATFCAPGECPCHDLLATMVAAHDDLVDAPVLPLAVQATAGPAWGATVVDRRVPFFVRSGQDPNQPTPPGYARWRVAVDADVPAFRHAVRALLGG